ncbi:MAG: MBL fold metallo-hydrolase [Thermodesulfobacteriota bacterium]
MEIIFLGTGGAWGLPEHACPCAACRRLRAIGQGRTRTSLWLQAGARIMIDCGPDARAQLMRHDLPRPDAVLISHEHGDHFLGLDELLCFRRAVAPADWRPIPVYAHPDAWPAIMARFAYLAPALIEPRQAIPGEPLAGEPFGPMLTATPVKTDHGPIPKGAVGYVIQARGPAGAASLGYTSDMVGLPDPMSFAGLDALVCQCHFLNEPEVNRPNHLSLQKALPLLRAWRPGRVFFAHISCQDFIPGDEPANAMLKKFAPAQPLAGPDGAPYPIPLDQAQWQAVVERVLADHGLGMPATVAHDGLRVRLGA